jgi:hypothetical protein
MMGQQSLEIDKTINELSVKLQLKTEENDKIEK